MTLFASGGIISICGATVVIGDAGMPDGGQVIFPWVAVTGAGLCLVVFAVLVINAGSVLLGGRILNISEYSKGT